MGYSVIVVFPDPDTRDKVLAFLEANLTPLHEILCEDTAYTRGPVSDPSYRKKGREDFTLGFDFSMSSDPESRLAYMVCYWAVRQIPDAEAWYDGLDKLKIPDNVNEDGFLPLEDYERRLLSRCGNPESRALYYDDIERLSALNPRVAAELSRLTRLWKGAP